MRSIILLLIAGVFSLNSFAEYWPQNEPIPITIVENRPDKFDFNIDTKTQPELIPGALYFFDDGEYILQGIYVKKEDGITHWTHMRLAPDNRNSSGTPTHTVRNPQPKENGYLNSSTHSKATSSAISTGIAHALYNGFIYDGAYLAEMNRLKGEAQGNRDAINSNYGKIRDGLIDAKVISESSLVALEKALSESANLNLSDLSSIDYQSTDVEFVAELKALEVVLRSSRSGVPKRAMARRMGLEFIQKADQFYSQGEVDEAHAFKQYAEAFADIAIGFDPITGPIRDIYEAFTGKNLITGDELSNWERAFAITGALSFGFGSKIARGVKAIQKAIKMAKTDKALVRAVGIDTHITRAVERSGSSAQNRALYEKYLRDLRRNMEKPNISDPQFKKFVDWYWHDASSVGNGSTAAALRYERLTGQKVGGKLHAEKAQHALFKLQRWIRANPNAVASDRAAAENMLKDLLDTLGGQ